MLLPPSLARGKAKAKPVEPALDLFGLCKPCLLTPMMRVHWLTSSASTSAAPPIASSSKTRSAVPPTISSAPAAPDFIPPEPTTQDPYPGYYQTPSGEWKAYDPDYYASFFASEPTVKLQGEVDENDGRVGRHWDEFNVKGAELKDVDVSDGLKAAREEEERKKLMKKPKISQDEFEYQVSVTSRFLHRIRKNVRLTGRRLDRSKGWRRNDTNLHPFYIQLILQEKRSVGFPSRDLWKLM